jgi:hypothetical protein
MKKHTKAGVTQREAEVVKPLVFAKESEDENK